MGRIRQNAKLRSSTRQRELSLACLPVTQVTRARTSDNFVVPEACRTVTEQTAASAARRDAKLRRLLVEVEVHGKGVAAEAEGCGNRVGVDVAGGGTGLSNGSTPTEESGSTLITLQSRIEND